MMLQGGQRRPLVLVVEDLHWIDKTSEEVLLHLADSSTAARVLLLVTYRPGYPNPFGERTYTTRIGLRTLSDHDSLRLAAGMLAIAEFPPELHDLIVRKAEGNPFFLEEVLKSLLEVGALRQRDGRYMLTKHVSEIYVPNTIQDVIMARIDRLEETPKRALQLASVIGREFTVRLLERISDVHAQLERFLQELVEGQCRYVTALHGRYRGRAGCSAKLHSSVWPFIARLLRVAFLLSGEGNCPRIAVIQ